MVTWYVWKCIYRYTLLLHAMNVLQWCKKVLLSYPNTLEMYLMWNWWPLEYVLHYKQCIRKWYTWTDVHTIVIQWKLEFVNYQNLKCQYWHTIRCLIWLLKHTCILYSYGLLKFLSSFVRLEYMGTLISQLIVEIKATDISEILIYNHLLMQAHTIVHCTANCCPSFS